LKLYNITHIETQQHPHKTSNLPLDIFLFNKGAHVLRAVRNKTRQKILKLIHDQEPITVTEIYKKLKLELSVASQQLGILRQSKFVVTKRSGKQIYYKGQVSKSIIQ
jgi:DNA-binding transcriptional ArsR family regulator